MIYTENDSLLREYVLCTQINFECYDYWSDDVKEIKKLCSLIWQTIIVDNVPRNGYKHSAIIRIYGTDSHGTFTLIFYRYKLVNSFWIDYTGAMYRSLSVVFSIEYKNAGLLEELC